MGDWDFLYGLDGQELDDAISSGGTAQDWTSWEESGFLESAKQTRGKTEWEKLKILRDSGQITKEEFRKRRFELFKKQSNN